MGIVCRKVANRNDTCFTTSTHRSPVSYGVCKMTPLILTKSQDGCPWRISLTLQLLSGLECSSRWGGQEHRRHAGCGTGHWQSFGAVLGDSWLSAEAWSCRQQGNALHCILVRLWTFSSRAIEKWVGRERENYIYIAAGSVYIHIYM